MNRTVRTLKETMALKGLSPERAAPFLDCSSRQIRRWIEGVVEPLPAMLKAIERGIRRINEEIPGDAPRGLVSWRAVEVTDSEKDVQNKLDLFFKALLTKAGEGGRSQILKIADENFPGFEEICFVASRLKVPLPRI